MKYSFLAIFVGIALLPSLTFATDTSVPFIRATDVHSQGYSGADATVAVIDTGIDYSEHGLLGSVAAGGTSFEGGVQYPDGGADVYDLGHGTYMSLIITDSSGVAPNAGILPIRVFGPFGANPADIVLGIDYVRNRRQADPSIRVINLSLGGGAYPCNCDNFDPSTQAYAEAISQALVSGIVTFVATGNDACCGTIKAPACVSAARAVTAAYDGSYGITNFQGQLCDPQCGDSSQPYYVTCFSDWAENCEGLSAPGYDIVVGGFSGEGTSQATAHCSGVAALMFGKNACGSVTAQDVRSIIFNTARQTKFAFPYCPLPPEPRHVDAFFAANAVPAAPCLKGDMNCDGNRDFFDIDPFLLALFDPAGYASAFPNSRITNGDMNGDGGVNFFDIDPFLACIFGGPCP